VNRRVLCWSARAVWEAMAIFSPRVRRSNPQERKGNAQDFVAVWRDTLARASLAGGFQPLVQRRRFMRDVPRERRFEAALSGRFPQSCASGALTPVGHGYRCCNARRRSAPRVLPQLLTGNARATTLRKLQGGIR
jgi:hypothetical protein